MKPILIGLIVSASLLSTHDALAAPSHFDCAGASSYAYFEHPFTMSIDGIMLVICAKGVQETYLELGVVQNPSQPLINNWTAYSTPDDHNPFTNDGHGIRPIYVSKDFKEQGGLLRFIRLGHPYETYRCMKQK